MDELRWNRQSWREFFALIKLYWQSEKRWQALRLLVVIVAIHLTMVYLLVMFNQWNNDFYNTLQNYDTPKFLPLVGQFFAIATAYVFLAGYVLYLQQLLQICWRLWLTDYYLTRWTGRRTYYKLQLTEGQTDNPDQRISEDIRDFVDITLTLFLGGFRQLVTLISFVAILWQLSGRIELPLPGGGQWEIPGYMVWIALVYAIAGTLLTVKVGRPLVRLNFLQQRYEANFRYNMVRYRENSENIAFYQGEETEKQGMMSHFIQVMENYLRRMRYQKQLTWFVNGYGQAAIIFPLFFVTPRYFAGEVTLGAVMQTLMAFGKVQDALSFFVEQYANIAQGQAVVARLLGFTRNMEQAEQMQGGSHWEPAEGELVVANMNVALPNGQTLLEKLSFAGSAGQHILITGATGCGKSTLLRHLSGIWPFGDGMIHMPADKNCFFLPQRPYMPLGTLRQALYYPQMPEKIELPEEMETIMRECGLEKFIPRLDEQADWARILSLGEQQRVAFVRVLLQKPDVLFLDEATSALDEPMEQRLYQLLQQRLPRAVIISVGHRSSLEKYHQQRLHLSGDGGWYLQPLFVEGR